MATTLTKDNREYIVKNWETVPCPFCNSLKFKTHEKFGPDHRYTYVQCESCKLVYLNPRPRYDKEFVETAYEVYDIESHHIKQKGKLNSDERKRVEMLKITLKQIESYLGRKGKILDIGCATGLFLYAARESGWETVGIDVSNTMVKHINENFKITALSGQYHELDLSAHGHFDVIYSSHCLEHIPNPNEWMKKFKLDLKIDGLLVLNVPNQFSLNRKFRRLLKILKLKRDHWALWRTPDHLFEPHIESMLYLISANNFHLENIFSYSHNEKERLNCFERLYHDKLKFGTKLRIFARPVNVLMESP